MTKIEFLHSVEKDWERIAHTYKRVMQGKYTNYGFDVLPYASGRGVYLPELEYDFSRKEMEKIISKEDDKSYFSPEIDWITDRIKNENQFFEIPKIDVDKFEKHKSELVKYIKSLKVIFPERKSVLGKMTIKIHLVNFGVMSSFNEEFADKGEIEIFVRVSNLASGFFLSSVCHSILNSFVTLDSGELGYSWYEKQIVVDYLVRKTFLKNFVKTPKNKRLTKDISRKEIPRKAAEESMKYLKRLGAEIKSKVNDAQIDLTLFTPNERRVFEKLFQNQGKLVNYHEIGEAIWGEESFEKYSLAAIQKTISRLRKKIENIGGVEIHIRAVTGRGFVMS